MWYAGELHPSMYPTPRRMTEYLVSIVGIAPGPADEAEKGLGFTAAPCLFVEGRPRACYPKGASGGRREANMAGPIAGESGFIPVPAPLVRSFVQVRGQWQQGCSFCLLEADESPIRFLPIPSLIHPCPMHPTHAATHLPPPPDQAPGPPTPPTIHPHPHHPGTDWPANLSVAAKGNPCPGKLAPIEPRTLA